MSLYLQKLDLLITWSSIWHDLYGLTLDLDSRTKKECVGEKRGREREKESGEIERNDPVQYTEGEKSLPDSSEMMT